ncbi:MAG: N(G),N(G)-dimethylarginine dimethylaminohydrolase [Anaerolineales bacterium]|nr:N(G),N(G)-dimethylarginine dimethylaminohydrolase [Anaerolineales bacterium]
MLAITREVSRAIERCELIYLDRTPINLSRARAQHEQYLAALRGLGLEVIVLPEEPDLPDSVFVEDAAIVLDEAAVLTNPGADSRKPEVESVARALAPYRRLLRLTAPATLDGGDVLTVGKQIFVGMTLRSNPAAVEQLRALLDPLGYAVAAVPVKNCLHLKTGVSQVAGKTLLINSNMISKESFPGFDFIEVDPSEPESANALLVKETIIYPAAYPRTRERLQRLNQPIVTVEADELAKAEGGVTCCSLILALTGAAPVGQIEDRNL